MKGVILAAGKGSRLFPATKVMSKPLLSVFDKPMVYYPISTLLKMGISEFAIVCSEKNIDAYKELFVDVNQLGITITYVLQKDQKGTADALLSAEKFIDSDPFVLIFADNIFCGVKLDKLLFEAKEEFVSGAFIFGYPSNDASLYGVVEFKKNNQSIIKRVVEKPKNPPSNVVVTGLYYYDSQAISLLKKLKPSKRGDLEITDLNNLYLKQDELDLKLLTNDCVWFDSGNPQWLHKASSYIKLIEDMQRVRIGCIEYEAFNQKFVSREDLMRIIEGYPESMYKKKLLNMLL